MVKVGCGGGDPEARFTAVFETLAVVVSRLAVALGDQPLPGLQPRRSWRPRGRVPGWDLAVAPADGAASLPAA
jgi:hypothetical protein